MANTETETSKVKRVASKFFIGPDGKEAGIDKATGLHYESLADKKVVDYQIPGAVAGSVVTMLALFGITTKATNTASFNRNNPGDDGKPVYESDVDAIQAFLDDLADGNWPSDRGGGFRIDIDLLLDAMQAAKPFADPAHRDRVRDRLETDADFRKTIREHSAIKPKYDALIAAKRPAKKDEKSLDDLLA